MKCFIFKYSKVEPENTISVNFGVWERQRQKQRKRQRETEKQGDRQKQRQSYICQVIGL